MKTIKLILIALLSFSTFAFGQGLPKPAVAKSTALAASLIIKATGGRLWLLLAYNDKASAQYIQIHDSATLPDEAAVPTYVFTLATKATTTISFGPVGLPLDSGIVVCNSSTAATKTIGSADCWFMGIFL